MSTNFGTDKHPMVKLERLLGVAVLAGCLLFMKIASPRNGVSPNFMRYRGMQSIAAGGVLFGICLGWTLTIHAW